MSGSVFSTGSVLWGQEGSASPCKKRTCLPNMECHQHQPLYARWNEGLQPAGCILILHKSMCAHSEVFFKLPVDNPPRWLHVPVHSVFWGADYGPLEVCVAQETSAYFLPSTCWCGLLQGWDAHKHAQTECTAFYSFVFFNACVFSLSVYCCCCLANVSLPGIGVSVPELRPFFYINVADIAALQTEMSYVACEFFR